MPRPQAYGRPGTPVIPVGWGRAHAPVLDKTMTAVIALATSYTTAWDDALERMVTTLAAPYATDVAARVQALTVAAGREQSETAEESVTVSAYLITVTHDLAPHVGDLIEVTASTDDAALVGRVLQVTGVVHGSERFERDIYASLQLNPAP